MRRLGQIMNVSALAYLCLPIILFAFGWLKIYYAVSLTILLIVAAVLSLKKSNSPVISNRPRLRTVLIALIIIMCWVGLSGIGGFSFQNSDHANRNATLRDLVQYQWPVIYDYTNQKGAPPLAGHKGALIYYLAFWLPAALIGKLWGWNAANIALYIWTVMGVFISFYYMSNSLKKFSLYLLLLFIFWSGIDFVGCTVNHGLPYLGQHIEWWASYFQYSSETTLLFWVFNQAVPVWVVIMLLCNQKNNKSLIFIYFLSFPYAPFPFIGLAPFVFYWAFFKSGLKFGHDEWISPKTFRKKEFLANFRSLLTFQNTMVPILIMLFFFVYFSSNPNNIPRRGYIGDVLNHPSDLFINYLLFCLLEFGIFALVIYENYKKDILFWMTIFVLVTVPLYYAGIYNDFAMRASIPALIILLLYTLNYLKNISNQRRKAVLIGLLVLGGLTAAQEIYRSIYTTNLNYSHRLADRGYTFGVFGKIDGIDKFVVADPQEQPFFKYFGKHLENHK